MHLGHGRAILYARSSDVQPFRDVILDACLHCYSVDAQSEGTRADYMLELVDSLPDARFYRDEVLKALPGSGDDLDAAQRFRFAACMAMDGDERAKGTMYENFEPGPAEGEGIAINFVQMDGLRGFLFAASKFGSLFRSNPDAQLNGDWLLPQAFETCGEQETMAALRQAALADPAIEAYLLKVEARAAKEKSAPHPIKEIDEFRALSYEQLRPRLSGSRGRLRDWGKHASDDELERAAHGLLSAQTPEEQIQHLRIFAWRPFPLDPTRLTELALSEDETLGRAAADALTQITHPSIRETALRLIRDRLPGREHVIDMLSRNFESTDNDLVLSWFETESDPETRHRMQMDLKKFWKDHPQPASEVRMLHAVYETGPCSFCREFVVKRLLELDALSASMRAECAFDAN